MDNSKIFKLTAMAGLALFGYVGTASAATVLCPGALGGDLTRQVEVTGALAGGECYYRAGNFQGDALTELGSYTLIEKDVAPFGSTTGVLGYTGSTSGTWSLLTNLWTTYNELFIAFHFGNGSGNPDSFIVELNPGTLSGAWALLPTSRLNGLSNIYLAGRSSGGGTSSGGQVPEPGTLTLLGLGLLGLGFGRRVAKSK